MRKLGVRALAALFCVGLAVSIAVAEDVDSDKSAASSGWWPTNWFAGKGNTEEKKKAEPVNEGPSLSERLSIEVQKREQDAYLRRLAVCDRLLEIALQTKDLALQQKVAKLNQQAFEVYKQRTTVPVGGAHFEAAEGFTESGKSKAKSDKVKPANKREEKP